MLLVAQWELCVGVWRKAFDLEKNTFLEPAKFYDRRGSYLIKDEVHVCSGVLVPEVFSRYSPFHSYSCETTHAL